MHACIGAQRLLKLYFSVISSTVGEQSEIKDRCTTVREAERQRWNTGTQNMQAIPLCCEGTGSFQEIGQNLEGSWERRKGRELASRQTLQGLSMNQDAGN